MPTPDDYNNQPGYRNFVPPPAVPDTFTRSNDRGSRDQHPVDPSNYNSPTVTQVAQAPTPSGYTPEEIAGAKARGMLRSDGLPSFPPGTVKFNSQGVPYNPARVGPPSSDPADPSLPGGTPPHPGEYNFPEPEPAAKPLPNLGAWTPDQAKPWMHVKQIPPQQVPDRPPDTHVGTRPAHIPRPGEAGYAPSHQPGQPYTYNEFLGYALQHGFTGQGAHIMAAIGLAESRGESIVTPNDGGKGYNSYGPLQINASNDAALIKAGFPGGARAALDINTAFAEAYFLSKGGTDFSPWTTYTHGTYKQYLDGNAQPAASSTLVAGPRQEYIPSQGREPQHWGSDPEHDWTPGRMPTAHDIPGILGALLPIAIAGVLGGGGLGMIAAYAGYQNARNKGQLEAAKEQRTLWQDRLKETESELKEELLESSGLMAQYGNDFTSDGARQAWAALAAKYSDTQLQAALATGNFAAVQQLFTKRDEAFQTLNKTSAATTKADEQAAAAEKAKADEGAMGFPETPGAGGGGTGAPGATPAAARRPWENLGPGFAGGGQPAAPPPAAGEEPAAGAPPAPQPAAAPTPPEQPAAPPSEEPPAAEPAPPGTPSATLPPVSVTAPAEPPPSAYSAPRTPFEAMVSDVVNGEEIEKLKPAISADGLKKLQFAAADKENQIEAVRPGPNAAAQLKAIDPTFGYYAEGVSNYSMPDPTARSQNRGYIARLFAAAQKINPQWDYKDYSTKQEFRTSFNPDKPVGMTLSRTARLSNLTKELADDANKLPNTNVATINQLIAWFQGAEVGDPRYTKFIADWRLFANDAQAVASGRGVPPVTLTSHLIDTLRQGATPPMIRQGLKEDLLAALSAVDSPIAGWHRQFPGQANPAMFDQGNYADLNRYAHMNIDTGEMPDALPDVGYSQTWGGQTHYYLGGDYTNKLNWSTVKPPGDQ